jgi:hypothetical protein
MRDSVFVVGATALSVRGLYTPDDRCQFWCWGGLFSSDFATELAKFSLNLKIFPRQIRADSRISLNKVPIASRDSTSLFPSQGENVLFHAAE